MRRPRPQHKTTCLPRDLRSELGIRDTYGEKKRRQNGPATRKDRRRAERTGKKSKQPTGPPKKNNQRYEQEDSDSDDFDLDEKSSDDEPKAAAKGKSQLKTTTKKAQPEKHQDSESDDDNMSIDLNEDDDKEEDESDFDLDEPEDDEDESTTHVSAKDKSKMAQDDAEIAALEKKLGMKKGSKLPKAFAEDGLDDILGELGDASEDEGKKRKREADEWLQSKRQKAQNLKAQQEKDYSEEDSNEDEDDLDDQIFGSEDDESGEGSDFEGFDEGEKAPPKKKENPYVAPVSKTENALPQKYIPPSLRALSGSESESLTRLKRQAQGQLNKLSEANMISIVSEFEKLYRDYPRQHVTSTVINLLFGLICERAVLQDTFMVLHAGFIAALYKLMGMDFGAEVVQKIVETLDAGGDERGPFAGKEVVNLVSLLSQLYNFHVIGSPLMFDYVRDFLADITEDNTELLLKVIRNSGPQLRQDDPSSLKDIVLMIQPAVAKIGEDRLSVRTKFMIETITDLKNNKVKNAIGANITSEHITKMRKILGSLNNSRVIRASEPISITRADILNSSKKGKWWLVGASWKEDPLVSARKELAGVPSQAAQAEDDSEAEPDLGDLARAHRMNTDIRRSIFVAIMSATDYQDAQVRLMKLRLKRAQEFEIPRVLLHCAMEEDAHNPYYTLIARRICGEMGRRIKMSFMFALWNIFKKMGERGDMDDEDEFDPDDEENGISMKAAVNLAKMFGMLIADGSLTLGVLKNLNFAYLQVKTKMFAELLFISIIQQSQKSKKSKKEKKEDKSASSELPRDEESLMKIFMRVQETPHIAKGIIFFLRKEVSKSDLLESESDQKMIRWGCNVAIDALKAIRD
ncbi:hypothetical protein N7478_002008 [Penicillium angulare]|uniref:uncharacterized protein n=1 Tax=Penicillium angulare TaxID=116970 RepID=UPI0025409A48|nr:uncharacterized protein N7478_002008 [Penicillium angulare]KAJ5288978.1 hypothetical protein N7478_002008 [Penicillium angulare]